MSKKLEKLLQQQEQLAQKVKQEQTRQKTRERKVITRRKVLLGALTMAVMEEDTQFRRRIEDRMEGFLVRKIDREVFGLSGGDEVPQKIEDPTAAEETSA